MNSKKQQSCGTSNPRRWPKLRDKILQHALWLRHQGGLVLLRDRGRKPAWVIRFRAEEGGRKVHRTIYIGGEDQRELLRRVRPLLERCRAQGQEAGNIGGFVQLARAAVHHCRRAGRDPVK